MTGRGRRSGLRWAGAFLSVMALMAGAAWFSTQGSPLAWVVGRGILVTCPLAVLVGLYARVRRELRVVDSAIPVAATRGPSRARVIPPDLEMVQFEVARALARGGEYESRLGPRLAALARRRSFLGPAAATPVDTSLPEGPADRVLARIRGIVKAIEES